MNNKYLNIIIFFTTLFLHTYSYSQIDIDSSSLSFSDNISSDTFVLDTGFKTVYKPILGAGPGIFTYYGEVSNNYNKNIFIGRNGFKLNVSRQINSFLNLNFYVIHGKLTGNERTPERNLNFETEVWNFGITVDYNFIHLIKKELTIMPYVALGFESFNFNSKADLYDEHGYKYYYWSDGTIRNLPESDENKDKSIIIHRDYKYETDLRKLNLDGLDYYPQTALSIPLDIGIKINLTDRISMRFCNSFHFTLSDRIDDISTAGTGERKGKKGPDIFIFNYFTLHYDLFATPLFKKSMKEYYKGIDFDAIYYQDEDKDGIIDFNDDCLGTPPDVKVDANGCPFDKDNDGIPDYRDQQPESPDTAIVDDYGVAMTPEQLAAIYSKGAIKYDEISLYYPSIFKGPKQYSYTEIPEKFKHLDLDKDNFISLDELMNAIDSYFDFKSNLTIEDIYELNDFYFNQIVK